MSIFDLFIAALCTKFILVYHLIIYCAIEKHRVEGQLLISVTAFFSYCIGGILLNVTERLSDDVRR